MIERDRGNQRHIRIYGIDCVEPTAQTDFQNDRIETCGFEDEQSRERIELEEGQRIFAAGTVDAVERCDE